MKLSNFNQVWQVDSANKILPTENIRKILQDFYSKSDLPQDGGLSELRAKVKLTKKFYLYIPNIDARRKALIKHDVHHLLTGYSTELKGELEIGGWEIGSGCRKYWAAWFLNMQSFMLGFLIDCPGVFLSFIRGRHSTNLYADSVNDNKVLDMTIAEVRSVITIPDKAKPTLADIGAYILNLFIGLPFSVGIITLYVPFLIIYNTITFIRLK